MPLRKPSELELQFIAYMIREGKGKMRANWSDSLMVAPMDNGGMGSLLLYPDGKVIDGRRFGRTLHEVEFRDVDHVTVVAALNLDQDDELLELDIWKVNFDALIRLPIV
jgi:hypothetical protein